MVTAEHIGKPVTDGVRTGILQAVYEDVNVNQLPEYRKPELVAWVRPEGGGIEWDARPSTLDLA
ncbi:hypothetical protein DF268_05210 [Streptomyces sp. V2]|uniref:DUF2442 domain-containing protein n=1 Tax=Streptomyces niveiscabiei TaxID=164115 RepID=A0ABW9HT27_9ACTN|nr:MULTISPECIES: hypothetical protein [Streptomyces]PWG14681.1 hypothetical protein DF268_05210 [Streptomyces sp. V2]